MTAAASNIRHKRSKLLALFFFLAFAILTALFLHLRFAAHHPRGPPLHDQGVPPFSQSVVNQAAENSEMAMKPASHLDLPSEVGARAAVFAFRSFTQPASAEPVELALYQDAALGTSSIKRVLIQIHGQGREAGFTWKVAAQARAEAAKRYPGSLKVQDVLIVAPLFFNGYDKDLYRWSGKGSTGSLLVWKGNQWGDGEPNQYPHTQTTVSSFEALDALLRYYSDHSRFPNVESIVVSGHSLGGQMVHRYAVLSDLPVTSPVTVSFIVANPSTLLYLDGDRPRHDPDSTSAKLVDGYNHYKYGLEGIADMLGEYYRSLSVAGVGGQLLWERFALGRKVHYINGDLDHGIGDERPQAFAQGKDRMDRLKNYIKWASMPTRGGDFPALHTVEWAEGVQHEAKDILKSEPGLHRAFLV
ncbi:hypothetical protein OC861_003498 [Tilletia horrida]|nr:hypothetical protein OC861_003498 [Tilletia horrida]